VISGPESNQRRPEQKKELSVVITVVRDDCCPGAEKNEISIPIEFSRSPD
jgi:hypothetical protein